MLQCSFVGTKSVGMTSVGIVGLHTCGVPVIIKKISRSCIKGYTAIKFNITVKFNIRIRQCKTKTSDEHKHCTILPFHSHFHLRCNCLQSCVAHSLQMMEHTSRCVAVSEPNSPSLFAQKYWKFGDSLELRQLARDIIRWECRPYQSMLPPPLGYFLKLRRYEIITLPMFRQHRHSVIT